MFKGMITLALLAGIPTVAMVGCATTPKTTAEQQDLNSSAQMALAQAKTRDATLQGELDRASGYAVFPNAGEGGFIAGYGWGRGVLYEEGMIKGYCQLTKGTLGAQIGGQEFSEIIVFQTRTALSKFKQGQFSFSGEASAVALESGAAGKSIYNDGVVVFTWAEKGLMAAANIGSQQFSYEPLKPTVEARPAGSEMKPGSNTEEIK